jgi:hypothetical protein
MAGPSPSRRQALPDQRETEERLCWTWRTYQTHGLKATGLDSGAGAPGVELGNLDVTPWFPHITSLAAARGMADQRAGHGLGHQDRRSSASPAPVLGGGLHAS